LYEGSYADFIWVPTHFDTLQAKRTPKSMVSAFGKKAVSTAGKESGKKKAQQRNVI